MFQVLSFKDISHLYQKTIRLLEQDVKTIDGRTGWHQFIGREKVGDVATAQGLLIFAYLERSFRLKKDLVKTLIEAQFQGTEAENMGGWSFLSSRDTPTAEPTVWAILGLLAAGESTDSDVLIKSREWLKNNQNGDGGWGPRKDLASRISTSFLACRALSILEPEAIVDNSPWVRNLIRWTRDSRNVDGGWAATSTSTTSTLIHTAFALMTLHTLGLDRVTQEMQEGIRYLYSQWDPQKMWENIHQVEQYEIPKDTTAWTRVTFQYFTTAWVTIALLTVGESVFEEEVFSSIRWIVNNQNEDGSWTFNDIEGRRLWAIHDGILAITTFISKVASHETSEQAILFNNAMILIESERVQTARRVFFAVIFCFVLIGILIGIIFGAGTGLHKYIGSWIQASWAWLVLGLYVVSAFPLAKFRVISWKDAWMGIILPGILIVVQLFLVA